MKKILLISALVLLIVPRAFASFADDEKYINDYFSLRQKQAYENWRKPVTRYMPYKYAGKEFIIKTVEQGTDKGIEVKSSFVHSIPPGAKLEPFSATSTARGLYSREFEEWALNEEMNRRNRVCFIIFCWNPLSYEQKIRVIREIIEEKSTN